MNIIDGSGLDTTPYNYNQSSTRPLIKHHVYDCPQHYRVGLPVERFQNHQGLLENFTPSEFHGFQKDWRALL